MKSINRSNDQEVERERESPCLQIILFYFIHNTFKIKCAEKVKTDTNVDNSKQHIFFSNWTAKLVFK